MKSTIIDKVYLAIEPLKVGEQLDKKAFIELHWGSIDFFIARSFDVAFCKAKKNFIDREFKTKNTVITRTK